MEVLEKKFVFPSNARKEFENVSLNEVVISGSHNTYVDPSSIPSSSDGVETMAYNVLDNFKLNRS